MGAAGLLAACTSDDRPPTPSSGNPSVTPSLIDEGAIYVFFTTEDALLPYDKSAYVQVERARRRDDATVEESLRLALKHLLKGPTSRERSQGFQSSFSDKTAGLPNKVEVVDGKALVDLRDFTKLIPEVSTSHAGAIFKFSLNLTVFQFDEIEQVQYSLEGNCKRYWEFLQAEVCRPPITRTAWDKVE